MRKLLLALCALVMFSVPANAGWNIKQKDDGGAVWVDREGISVPVGDSGLVVILTDMSTATTAYVVSHRKGKITKFYVTNHQATAGTAVIDIHVNSSAQAIGIAGGVFTPVSAGAAVSVTGITPGNVFSVDVSALNNDDDGIKNDVLQGDVIAIHTDGGSTTGSVAKITIIIE